MRNGPASGGSGPNIEPDQALYIKYRDEVVVELALARHEASECLDLLAHVHTVVRYPGSVALGKEAKKIGVPPESVVGVVEGSAVMGKSCQYHIAIVPKARIDVLEWKAVLDGGQDDVAIALETFVGAEDGITVLLDGSHDDAVITSENIVGPEDSVTASFHTLDDKVAVMGKTRIDILKGFAIRRHGSEDNFLVATERPIRIRNRLATTRHCRQDKLTITFKSREPERRPMVPQQALNEAAILIQTTRDTQDENVSPSKSPAPQR